MALLFHNTFDSGVEIGLWKIEEEEIWYMEQMNLFPAEEELLKTIGGHRKLEWLAGRWLLHYMSGRFIRGGCLKDEHGKPYLEDSIMKISLSHSRKMVAVMAGPKEVGVDIQQIIPKITRLAHKFISEKEASTMNPVTELEAMHVYWGAKECLYKAYGRRQLDFKTNIEINGLGDFDPFGGDLTGIIRKDDFLQNYWLKYEMIENYVFVYGMEV